MLYFSNGSLCDRTMTELTTDNALYNVRGVVTQHLSKHFVVVQTPYGLVLCHSGTVYSECEKSDRALLPSLHWVHCDLTDCLPVGTKVLLHATRLREVLGRASVGKMVCQVANLVWTQGGERGGPPETGPILPGTKKYFEIVYGVAQKYAQVNQTTNVFSNVTEEENLLKYNMALEASKQEKVTLNVKEGRKE